MGASNARTGKNSMLWCAGNCSTTLHLTLHAGCADAALRAPLPPHHPTSPPTPTPTPPTDEDHGGGLGAGLRKEVAHAGGPHAHKHLHEVGAGCRAQGEQEGGTSARQGQPLQVQGVCRGTAGKQHSPAGRPAAQPLAPSPQPRHSQMVRKGTPASPAVALASSVLPVPARRGRHAQRRSVLQHRLHRPAGCMALPARRRTTPAAPAGAPTRVLLGARARGTLPHTNAAALRGPLDAT